VVLDATDLYRFFHAGDDEVLALRGVSLRVESGEIVAVVGPSGSGKSTLMACLAGLDEPDGGQVRIAGQVLTRQSEARRAELRASHVGVVFQSDNLVGHLDVDANIALAQRLAGRVDSAARDALVARLGLASRQRALPSELSGGEAVRAALAVALVNQPPLILADEPTGELDEATEQRVLELLDAEAAAGRAVVIATHSDAVTAVAHRVVRLADGVEVSR
jgi:putative ABC transport system ATP-binding protein